MTFGEESLILLELGNSPAVVPGVDDIVMSVLVVVIGASNAGTSSITLVTEVPEERVAGPC